MDHEETRFVDGEIQHKCWNCEGRGWTKHVCNGHRIGHPLNDRGYPPSWLYRCPCGRYYRRFYAGHNDSIDLPKDEFLGTERPPDNWTPDGGWSDPPAYLFGVN